MINELLELFRSLIRVPSGSEGSKMRPMWAFFARVLKKVSDAGDPISSSGVNMTSHPILSFSGWFSRCFRAVIMINIPLFMSVTPGPFSVEELG